MELETKVNTLKPLSRKQKLATVIRRFSPELADLVEAFWFRQHTRRWHWDLQCTVASKLYPNGTISVLTGPFRGMIYENRVYFGPITPRWIGSYEMELHPVIEEIASGGYEVIVDIGSAEGYYSVGLARRIPGVEVFSFDTDLISRYQQRRLARLNEVTNLHIDGFCDHGKLEKLLRRRACVICDIEGWEVVTLDPLRVPNLATADILVEIHPFRGLSGEQCGAVLEERFRNTHSLHRVHMENRQSSQFQHVLKPLSEEEAQQALDEHRGREQQWFWLRSRQEPGAGTL